MPVLLVYSLDTLLLIAVLYAVWLEYKAQHVAAFFWATVLGIYVIPAFVDAELSWAPVETGRQVRLAGEPVLVDAPLFALLFTLTYLVARHVGLRFFKRGVVDLGRDLTESYASDRVAHRFVAVLTIAAIIGALFGLYSLYSTTGAEGLSESGYQQFRLNADPTYLRPAVYLLAASSGGVFLAWRVRNRVAVTLIVASTVLYFLLAFARQTLVFILAPFALYLLYSKRSILPRMALLAGVLCGYYGLIFLLLLRYEGSNAQALEALFSGELFHDFVPKASHEGGELTLRYVYYYFIENRDATASVMPGQTYLRLLMLPIPSEYSFGFKPGLVDVTLWYAYYPEFWQTEGGSLHALIFGDSFANLGWAGVLLGAVWAWVAHASTRLLALIPKVVRTVSYAPLGFGAVMVARGAVYNASAAVFWSLLLIILLYWLAKVSIGRAVDDDPAWGERNQVAGALAAPATGSGPMTATRTKESV